MRKSVGPILVLILSLAAGQAQAGLLSTTSSNKGRTDCSGLALQGASGVPNDEKHAYKLAGICLHLMDLYVDGDHDSTKEIGRAFSKLTAKWDGKTNELKETLKLDGVEGDVESVFKCGRDPYIYSTTCTLVSHGNTTDWPELSTKPVKNQTIGAGKTSLAEASAASAKQASAPPPPPPPPPAPSKPKEPPKLPATTPARAGNLSGAAVGLSPMLQPRPVAIEAETLVDEAKANTGRASHQQMGVFGSGWSDDAQLFWNADGLDSALTLALPTIVPGRYRLKLQLTKAPDFGIFQAAVNGKELDRILNLYHPNVVPSGTYDMGEVAIVGGQNDLTFFVIGKDRRSQATFVGIDRIELEPMP